jgi:hypothetical protein
MIIVLNTGETLYLQERNFRVILRDHTLNLLKFQKEYWRKRYTIRWTKFGDESTKFFHAAATERYRQNTISSLDSLDGRQVTEHFEKAALLWETYKARMGTSCNPHMLINLRDLIPRNENLGHLSDPITREEIESCCPNATRQIPWPRWLQWSLLQKVLAHHQRRCL